MYGLNYAADHTNGKLYEYSLDIYSDDGESIIKQRDTAVIHGGLFGVPGQKLNFDEVEFIILNDTGEVEGTGLGPQRPATLTLTKTVTGGDLTQDDFQAYVNGVPQEWDVAVPWEPGEYTITEDAVVNYEAGDWGGDAAANGTITLTAGGSATATITNTYFETGVYYAITRKDTSLDYIKMDMGLGTTTILASTPMSGESIVGLVCDGENILTSGPVDDHDLVVYEYNGSAFVQTVQNVGASLNIWRYGSGGDGYFHATGQDLYGRGIAGGTWSKTHIDTPTRVSYTNEAVPRLMTHGHGSVTVRTNAEKGTPVRGTQHIGWNYGAVSGGQRMYPYSMDTGVPVATSAWTGYNHSAAWGYDLDHAILSVPYQWQAGELPYSGTYLHKWTFLNNVLTYDGRLDFGSQGLNYTPMGHTWVNANLVMLSSDLMLRTYSISGTTMTLIDELDSEPYWLPRKVGANMMHQDPLTGLIICGAVGDGCIGFRVDDDGIFTAINTLDESTSLVNWNDESINAFWFLDGPLTVSP